MTAKLLTAAAALALVLPVAAHAEEAVRDMNTNQQRQIERSQYESERTQVRGRLSNEQRDSVTDPSNARSSDRTPSTLNRTAPSAGTGTPSGSSASGTSLGTSATGTAQGSSASGTPSGRSASGTAQGSSASGTASSSSGASQ